METMTIQGRQIRAVLLDCDGVVLDTEGQYSRFWGRVGRERFPNVPDFATRIKGQTLVQIKADYFRTQEDLGWIDRELDAFERRMDYTYIHGAEAFLRYLRREGIPVALVTSSDHAKMEKVYGRRPEFRAYFDAVITAEDVRRSKPEPDCFLRGAAALGVPIGECVAVEDSPNGLRAARRSGAFVVGLATTCPAEVIVPLADVVVDALDDLLPDDSRE